MNKIIIKGRLTRDPDLKTGSNGIEFCKFTVAVDRRKLSCQNGCHTLMRRPLWMSGYRH